MATENYDSPASPVMVNKANLLLIRQDSNDSNSLSPSDICKLFDEFLHEFEQMEKSGSTTTNVFLDAVEEIANAVLQIIPYKLLDPKVLYHPLMYFLHQMLVDLLANWNASRLRLNIQETDIFLKIVTIFLRAAEQAPPPDAEEARKRIRDLLATKRFLFLVRDQIIDSTQNKDGVNDDPNVCTVGLLTLKLLRGCPFYYTVDQNEHLLDDLVINCLDSYDYVQALHQLQHGNPLTDIDRLLLFTCWEYIPFVSTNSRKAAQGPDSVIFIQDTYDGLLIKLENALKEPQPIAPASLVYIHERIAQLLNIENLQSFDKHATNVVDHLTTSVQNSPATNSNDDTTTTDAFKALYNLSTIPDVRTIMRKRQLTPLLTKYTSKDMGEKRKLAFSILAQTMSEEEVNNNPTEITAFFTEKLKELDPKGYNPHTDIVLSSLKALVHHEQPKNEFVKLDGLDTLTSFIRDGNPDKQSDKQLEEAIQILWSCALNDPEALKTLRNDTKLMARVNQLHKNAKKNDNPGLEKAAEGLIWKVEKEEQFKQQQIEEAERKKKEKEQKAKQKGTDAEEEEEEEEQYDCMLSYSWADMDLAHRIFHHLTEKLGYKIWLDQEQMHGSTIEAMANAVENAQFILMCMSDTYRRSANCQSEAEYAFNRKKHIVPLKMKAEFVAEGWLGFILGTRMYIDFGTYEFEKAIELLDNEIQLQKKRRKEAKQLARAERKAVAASEALIDVNEKAPPSLTVPSVKGNPESLSNWNEADVYDFLMKNNLTAMVPLCDGVTGEELSDLYAMCRANSASMYRSLKFELLHGHHRILPISTFLRFVSRVRAACEDGLPSNSITMKKNSVTPFSDDE